ncbi:MAG: MTAP family purine nucleoside phosphorylase [Deltaproteobacteria bacterium]|nr:MTAP family purine nucleoside phosphorylase [Deltaproteobacteria bacterium]
MKKIGIVSGTLFLDEKGGFAGLEEKVVETEYGHVLLFLSRQAVFVPRHGNDPQRHILPHEINHRANLKALKDAGVSEVISINSTGSLKKTLKPGMIVIPDDFLVLSGTPTTIQGRALHLTPAFDEEVRRRWLQAAKDCGIEAVDGGIYWQTAGPRLETRAEIAMMKGFADLVGMTMASEAVIAQELDLPYGALCSVDNYAHGLTDRPLAMNEIRKYARKNAKSVRRILQGYLERFFSEGP